MKLSVIVPGIRPYNWSKLYYSVYHSFGLSERDFEVIFVGPEDIADGSDKECLQHKNVKYIRDWGSPARCMNIGLTFAVGQYITWAADDGVFLPDAKGMLEVPLPTNSVITSKYTEGAGNGMHEDWYYRFKTSIKCEGLSVHPEWYILNIGLIPRDLLEIFGGWDGHSYEGTFMSHLDLAARLHQNHINFIMYDKPIFTCSHMPDITGDHAPVHYAQTQHDEAMFRYLWANNAPRITTLDNWKLAPPVWSRRFTQ